MVQAAPKKGAQDFEELSAPAKAMLLKPFQSSSVLEGVTKLFYYGIGQDFASNFFYFGFGFVFGDAPVESYLEILTLPHIVQAFVANFRKGAIDRFTLRIQNALLQRDVDVGFHQPFDYTSARKEPDRGSAYRRHPFGGLTFVRCVL
jgi:hypothetical protein